MCCSGKNNTKSRQKVGNQQIHLKHNNLFDWTIWKRKSKTLRVFFIYIFLEGTHSTIVSDDIKQKLVYVVQFTGQITFIIYHSVKWWSQFSELLSVIQSVIMVSSAKTFWLWINLSEVILLLMCVVGKGKKLLEAIATSSLACKALIEEQPLSNMNAAEPHVRWLTTWITWS